MLHKNTTKKEMSKKLRGSNEFLCISVLLIKLLKTKKHFEALTLYEL